MSRIAKKTGIKSDSERYQEHEMVSLIEAAALVDGLSSGRLSRAVWPGGPSLWSREAIEQGWGER